MRKPRYGWWGYVKGMIRQYPKRKGQELFGVVMREYEAVNEAVEETAQMKDGADRLMVIDLVLWKGTHQIPGAALQVPCSERTAQQWHADFIKMTAKNFGLLDQSLR